MVAAACMAFAWAIPVEVCAQASRLGGMITVAQGSIRYADIGYDPINNVYLIVSGAERVMGRFVSGDGTALGNVATIPDVGAGAYGPRVTYSADVGGGSGGFLVTWLDLRLDPRARNTHVRGRVVRYEPSTGQIAKVSADFYIAAAPGGAGAESPAVSAYSPTSREFLVAWRQGDGSTSLVDIHAQRVDTAGNLLGGEFALTVDRHWQTNPAVGYDPASNSFLVAYQNFAEPAGPDGIQVRRVDAGTGVMFPPVQIFTSGISAFAADVTNVPGTGNYLVSFFTGPRGTGVHFGQMVDASGNPLAGSAPVPLMANSPSYDARNIEFSPVSNSFVAVMHGSGPEDIGIEFNASGVVSSVFDATATGAPKAGGNFHPRVAARTSGSEAEWMVGVHTSNGTPTSLITAQRIGSPTRNPAPGGGPPPPPPPPPPPDPTQIDTTNAPNGTVYFAEGNGTADGVYNFNTYYQLLNTNDNVDATVRAYFAKQTDDGSVVLKERTIIVPKKGRTTVDLKAQVGTGAWSAVFQSQTIGVPVEAQESVFWGENLEGSSSEASARSAGPMWLFAEGTRGANDYFATFFQLFNPLTTPIEVVGEYFTNGSSQPITRTYTLPGSGRYTVFANGIPELAGLDFSTRFRAADGQAGFVAQRAMYWGPNYAGGHTSMGVGQAMPTWQFAEGAAFKNFDTYYLVLNPNPFDVTVDVSYLTEAGFVARPGPDGGAITVKANSRMNVHLNSDLGNVGAVAATFTTRGGHGIVVERSIYWGTGFPNWVEGTNAMGVSGPAMEWLVPEGSDSGLFDTYLLVANPNAYDVAVEVAIFVEGVGRYTPPTLLVVKAFSRETIDMSNPANLGFNAVDLNDLKGKSFGASVTSKTANGPIIVEQAIYRDFQTGIFWRAGASAFGVPRIQ